MYNLWTVIMVHVGVWWFRKKVNNLKWTLVHSHAKKQNKANLCVVFPASTEHSQRPHLATLFVLADTPQDSSRQQRFAYIFRRLISEIPRHQPCDSWAATSNIYLRNAARPIRFSFRIQGCQQIPHQSACCCCCVDKLSCWYVSVGRCVRVSSPPQKYTHFWP